MDYDTMLDRNELKNEIIETLSLIESEKHDIGKKRAIYVYGNVGVGKTTFVTSILKEKNYDVVRYDTGDSRNKTVIEMINENTISERNVLSMFQKKSKPIAVLMDDIDGMNSGDKGGINSLIKLMRPKKTQKQKSEKSIFNTVVCIGNTVSDKKINELMKVCHCFYMPPPSTMAIERLIGETFSIEDPSMAQEIARFVKGNLHKLCYMQRLSLTNNDVLKHYLHMRTDLQQRNNEDTKNITKNLFNKYHPIDSHNSTMNETDRTIVGLLWHENVIDFISKLPHDVSFPLYQRLLACICYGDFIDRTMFQCQVWCMNELSSLIKTFYSNFLYHTAYSSDKPIPGDIRFTKVLTKYSTEYNNSKFVASICEQLTLDKKDTISFAIKTLDDDDAYAIFQSYDICKMDTDRLHRYVRAFT